MGRLYMVYTAIKKLVQYGLETGLITETDRIYATNQLLEALKLEAYEEPEDPVETGSLEEILRELLDYACEQGLIEDSIAYRDLFDAKLMNCLMPRPSEVEQIFWNRYQEGGPEAATNYFYKLSQDSDYIRRYRVCKDQKWVTAHRMEIWISPLIYQSRRKIRRLSRLPSWQSRAATRNVCFAWRMRATQVV